MLSLTEIKSSLEMHIVHIHPSAKVNNTWFWWWIVIEVVFHLKFVYHLTLQHIEVLVSCDNYHQNPKKMNHNFCSLSRYAHLIKCAIRNKSIYILYLIYTNFVWRWCFSNFVEITICISKSCIFGCGWSLCVGGRCRDCCQDAGACIGRGSPTQASPRCYVHREHGYPHANQPTAEQASGRSLDHGQPHGYGTTQENHGKWIVWIYDGAGNSPMKTHPRAGLSPGMPSWSLLPDLRPCHSSVSRLLKPFQAYMCIVYQTYRASTCLEKISVLLHKTNFLSLFFQPVKCLVLIFCLLTVGSYHIQKPTLFLRGKMFRLNLNIKFVLPEKHFRWKKNLKSN